MVLEEQMVPNKQINLQNILIICDLKKKTPIKITVDFKIRYKSPIVKLKKGHKIWFLIYH